MKTFEGRNVALVLMARRVVGMKPGTGHLLSAAFLSTLTSSQGSHLPSTLPLHLQQASVAPGYFPACIQMVLYKFVFFCFWVSGMELRSK